MPIKQLFKQTRVKCAHSLGYPSAYILSILVLSVITASHFLFFIVSYGQLPDSNDFVRRCSTRIWGCRWKYIGRAQKNLLDGIFDSTFANTWNRITNSRNCTFENNWKMHIFQWFRRFALWVFSKWQLSKNNEESFLLKFIASLLFVSYV